MWRGKNGQSITEYAIIIGIIGSALLMMSVYFQRSIQLVIKEPVDNLGGFGSGIYRPQRVQEMGIEDNVIIDDNGALTVPVPYESNSNFSSTNTVTTRANGERISAKNEEINTPWRTSRSYQRIEYDQITR